jgi:hypothetical protein
MPANGRLRSCLVLCRKRWRQRKLVFLWMPVSDAARRTVFDPSMLSRYTSHLLRWRNRAKGVPVNALKLRRQSRQR